MHFHSIFKGLNILRGIFNIYATDFSIPLIVNRKNKILGVKLKALIPFNLLSSVRRKLNELKFIGAGSSKH